MTISFSEVHGAMGGFGRYQWCLLVMATLLCMYDSEMVTMVFVGGRMDHRCLVPELEHLSLEMQRMLSAVPLGRGNGGATGVATGATGVTTDAPVGGKRFSPQVGNGSAADFDSCLRYERNYTHLAHVIGNATDLTFVSTLNENVDDLDIKPCEMFAYSSDQFESTIVSQFDLVCGLEFLVPLVSTLYMLGGLIGCLAAGYVSDAIGRKRTLMVNMVLRVSAMAVFVFGPTMVAFVLGRCVLGFAGNAVRVTHFVLVMEMFEPSSKTYVTTLLVIGISLGAIFMSLVAMFVRGHFLYQIFVFSPILLLFPYAIFLLPESPRWLHLNGKHDEVNRILTRVSRFNGRQLPDHIRSENLEPPKKAAECKTSELFTNKLMLLRVIVPGYVMLTGSLIYFAIMLNISSLAGDVYVNSCVSSAIEVPGYVLGLYFCNHEITKRRLTLVLSMCIVGVLQLICIPVMLTDHLTTNSALMLTSRAFVCAAVLVMTIYSAELLPTQVRNTGFGFLMTCARMGSMVAPYAGRTLIQIWKPLPSAIFGTMSLTSGLLCLFLPETRGEPVFDTIYEIKIHHQNLGTPAAQKQSGIKVSSQC